MEWKDALKKKYEKKLEKQLMTCSVSELEELVENLNKLIKIRKENNEAYRNNKKNEKYKEN